VCYSQAQNDLPPFRQPLTGSQPKHKDQTDHSSTRAIYLWDDSLSLSHTCTHTLSGCVLSLFTLGRSSPSFFFNFHLIFWFFGSLVFHLCVSHSTSPPFLYAPVSPYKSLSCSQHIWCNFMLFILLPRCPLSLLFSWFHNLSLFTFMPLNILVYHNLGGLFICWKHWYSVFYCYYYYFQSLIYVLHFLACCTNNFYSFIIFNWPLFAIEMTWKKCPNQSEL